MKRLSDLITESKLKIKISDLDFMEKLDDDTYILNGLVVDYTENKVYYEANGTSFLIPHPTIQKIKDFIEIMELD